MGGGRWGVAPSPTKGISSLWNPSFGYWGYIARRKPFDNRLLPVYHRVNPLTKAASQCSSNKNGQPYGLAANYAGWQLQLYA